MSQASDSGAPAILTETRGQIYIVTINRSERRNALDAPAAAALADAFRAFDANDGLAVAILTGADGVFSAGFDLKSVAENVDPPRVGEGGDGPLGVTHMLLSKPVIAAVEGYAVAGGLEIALWCDLRVAAENAVFGVYNRRWGVPLIDGGTIRLPRMIGQSHALDMILTGRSVSGQEALTMGLANRLTEPGQTLETAIELAENLARVPQRGLRSDRLAAYEQWSLGWEDALRNEMTRGRQVLDSGESVAGAKRFAEGHGRHGNMGDI